MKFHISVAGLLLAAGCIDFDSADTAFCDNATPEHRLIACADRLGPEPTSLSITGLPTSLDVGTCSGAIRIQSVDGSGNKAVVRADTVVGLGATPSVGIAFYSDGSCTTPANAVALAAGGSEVAFSFKSYTIGSLRIDASAQGLADGTGDLQIARGNGNGLAFLTVSKAPLAGTCSTPVTIQLQDSNGSPVQLSSDTQVGLTSDALTGLNFFDTSGCSGAPITTLTVRAGQNSATFYFKMTTAGAFTLTASSVGLASAIQTETVSPGPPSELALTTGAQLTVAGSCSNPVTVQSQDAYGNTTKVATVTNLNLQASFSSGVTFYSGANCIGGITQAVIQPGTSSATFYFASTTAGALIISVTAAGLTSVSQIETIRAATGTKLAFTGAPVTLGARACSGTVDAQLRDAFDNAAVASGNLTVNLTKSVGSQLVFYSDSTCGLPTSSTTIMAGQSSGPFYVKDIWVEPVDVTASANGYDAGSATIVIEAPSRIQFTSASKIVPLYGGSGPVTFEVQDQHGDATPLPAASSVSVSLTGLSAVFCGTPSTCGPPYYSNGSVSLPQDQSSGTFYFVPFAAGGTLTATLNATVRTPDGGTVYVFAQQSETVP